MLEIFVSGVSATLPEKDFEIFKNELQKSIVALFESKIGLEDVRVAFLKKYPDPGKIRIFIVSPYKDSMDEDMRKIVWETMERYFPGDSIKCFVLPK
jgi:hypothetical protein